MTTLTVNVGETYAGMMVGLLLASVLCGLANVQGFIYFFRRQNDSPAMKYAIGFLWGLDVLQLVFVFSATYYYVIKQVGVSSPPFVFTLKIQILLQVLIMFLTKVMYTVRLWKLAYLTEIWVPLVVTVFVLVDFIIGCAFAHKVFGVTMLTDLVHLHFKAIAVVSMCFTTVTDFMVGVALIYGLSKSDASRNWTNSTLTMLVAYVLNTGVITGLFSLIVILAFAIRVQSAVFSVAEMILPQCYVNCFLSMVNASVYFQTNKGRSEIPSVHILPLFDDEGSTKTVIEGAKYGRPSPITLQLPPKPEQKKKKATINEMGFPLFKSNFFNFMPKSAPVAPSRSYPVEVRVQTSQHSSSERYPSRGHQHHSAHPHLREHSREHSREHPREHPREHLRPYS